VSILNPFYEAIAWLIVRIHSGMAPIFGSNSGAAWALSIVLLTMAMRLLLFPLFVKQIRNQRAMTALQPKMKELQAKYKNDKEKLNQEMMALWREAGANPLAGCLPLILQIPVFLALFRVLNSIQPGKHCTALADPNCFSSHYGISKELVHSAAVAKIFGVPISASFSSSKHTLDLLSTSATSTRVLAAVLIVLMGASTFITQRQLMARSGASGAEMPQQQKMLLYILPLFFAVFGLKFPLGVLLYWLTTNFWSMGQQAIVIRRMDAAPAVAGPAVTGPAPGAKPVRPKPAPAGGSNLVPPAAAPPMAAPGSAPADGACAPPTSPGPSKAAPPRRPAGRSRRNRRGRR
jgi:YidC/Oxa1 family membrane protein insertase